MRCLIPITQEIRNKNAIKRACKICDKIHLLYVVDESIFERMERESAYVLNSDMLAVLRNTLIESQRKEAESCVEEIACKDKVELHFEEADYLETIERYALRLNTDLIMTDFFERGFFGIKTNIWVDGGNDIHAATFVIDNAIHISKIKNSLSIVEKISGILGCELKIYGDRKDILKAVSSRYARAEKPDGDLIIIAKSRHSATRPHRITLFYLNL